MLLSLSMVLNWEQLHTGAVQGAELGAAADPGAVHGAELEKTGNPAGGGTNTLVQFKKLKRIGRKIKKN